MKILLKVVLGLILLAQAPKGPEGWRLNHPSSRVEGLLVVEPVETGGLLRIIFIDSDPFVEKRPATILHELSHLALASERNDDWQLALTFGALYAVWKFIMRWQSRHRLPSSYVKNVAPPLNAEFLFYLVLDAQNCNALVGDLEERYRIIYKKFGPRKANFWYWTQAIRSVGPIASAWMKKAARKPVIGVIAWAVAKGLIGHHGWLAALVEIWKRIRL
jgi:hypothetical protein